MIKITLGGKSVNFGKMRFRAKSASRSMHELTYPYLQRDSGTVRTPKVMNLTKSALFHPKRILGPKVLFWRKSAHFAQNALFGSLVADAYKTCCLLMKFHHFGAQKRFWSQKCAFGAKMTFCRQKAYKDHESRKISKNANLGEFVKKVNSRFRASDTEQDFPDAGPERIHVRGRQNM